MAERYDEPRRGGDDIRVVPADRDPGREDPQAIRAEIEETRERMSHTLDEITERLNPNHLKEQLKSNVREATIGRAEHMARNAASRVSETRHSIMDTVRDNPIPAAMVGIGLGWLFWNGRKEESHDAYGLNPADRYVGDRYTTAYAGGYGYAGGTGGHEGTMDQVRERAGEMGDEVRERADELTGKAERAMTDAQRAARDAANRARSAASEAAGRAQQVAGSLAQQTRRGAHRVEDRFQDALRESPLAVGAAALAVGLAVGLSAPTTEQEVELMGDTRDQLVGRAREMAKEKAEQAQHVAERVAGEMQSAAQETVKQAAKDEGLTG